MINITRARRNKYLGHNVLSTLSIETTCKPSGKKWNAKEKNTEQKNINKTTLKVEITPNVYC